MPNPDKQASYRISRGRIRRQNRGRLHGDPLDAIHNALRSLVAIARGRGQNRGAGEREQGERTSR